MALKFGKNVLRTHPDVGLSIFTSDSESEKWPRKKVYELFKSSKVPVDMLILLIEHYVYEWNDQTEQTLYWLIMEYRETGRIFAARRLNL